MPGPQLTFDQVLTTELRDVHRRRKARSVEADAPLVGLSLSGGGIRSAAVCLGGIQALRADGALDRFDYLSTVSGGGYIGSSLTAAMSRIGDATYPFGDDVKDSAVIAHLRNYSNYLLPRDRSSLRNWLEAAAVVLRGLAANFVCVLAFLVGGLILTLIAYPDRMSLHDPNFGIRLAVGLIAMFRGHASTAAASFTTIPMLIPLLLTVLLALVLLTWAALRTLIRFDVITNDTTGTLLRIAYGLMVAFLVMLYFDLQPVVIRVLIAAWEAIHRPAFWRTLGVAASAALPFLAFFSGRIGRFLETSEQGHGAGNTTLRLLAKFTLIVGSLILPAMIWATYAALFAWATSKGPVGVAFGVPGVHSRLDQLTLLWAGSVLFTCCVKSNNYSLHWLYRDRLSRAFLVGVPTKKSAAENPSDPVNPLNTIDLSSLAQSIGPYPLINAALNVQGSLEANKRGRNADFFVFTPRHVGSELTSYIPVTLAEELDPRLNLASAMAISGAAASANMGASTVRMLSPTLSLMNVRLGYYLDNPRYAGKRGVVASGVRALARKFWDLFFLLNEMFNLLTETRGLVYLTDGGHIENLGIYELLKRRCRLIVAIDSEADPNLACGSLLRLERYARIDQGVRIVLPWEQIAHQAAATRAALWSATPVCENGPHCAIGRIIYPDGEQGILAYVKSSLTGDEKDYVLDYARRNSTFPHESTGDQFFSEEQFEMYRALGFHMVDGIFKDDRVAFVQGEPLGFVDEDAARVAVTSVLGRGKDRDRKQGNAR